MKFKGKKQLIKKGQGYIHESMDRLHVIECNLEDFVINAPVAKTIPSIKEKLEKAQSLMAEAYQEIGQLRQ